jgi:hypothetical protein
MTNATPKTEVSKRRKRRWRWIVGGAGLLLLLLVIDYFAYPYGARPGERTFNTGENGLWLRYTWYFGQKSDADLSLLARRLQERQIRYAYFHVRDITEAGRLRYHYPDAARRLVTALHHAAPAVRVLAWVYVGNPRGEGAVNLADPQVRQAMVHEAQWLVQTCGFDGVQWDYEVCDDGDPDFLRLLRETRVALPQGALLSAAVPLWMPRPLQRWGWSDAYFGQTAALCDQITVLCYDSGFWLPRSYVWLVRQQAIHVTHAVARSHPSCRVLLGVPTYRAGGLSHNARAENLSLALRGVREGLSDPHADISVFAGVAPFADYTTGPEDWETYRTLWLQRRK